MSEETQERLKYILKSISVYDVLVSDEEFNCEEPILEDFEALFSLLCKGSGDHDLQPFNKEFPETVVKDLFLLAIVRGYNEAKRLIFKRLMNTVKKLADDTGVKLEVESEE